MLTSVSRPVRTLFLLAVSALFFGLVVPVAPASAAAAQVTVTISGTAAVGSTLTANVTLNPSTGGVKIDSYKWQSVDGANAPVDIPGAAGGPGVTTVAPYVPTSDMIGKKIQVVVNSTGSNNGTTTPGTGTSGQTAAVVAGTFTSAGTVTISDTTPQVDQTVNAVVTGTNPSGATYTYQWYTITGTDPAVLVAGATNVNFTVADTDLNKKLLVKVIASKAGYTSSNEVSSAATTAVATATFTTPPTATIDNTSPKVNETINAVITGTSPSSGVTYTYQWYTASPTTLISGATGSSYTVTGDDLGKKLFVKVIASKVGYANSAEVSSTQTNAVAPADFTSPPTVTIDNNNPTVGDTLTASGTDAVPSAGTTYTYQWYTVDGGNAPVAINGATGSTYLVAGAGVVGKKIIVKKTANKSGYTSVTATSTETAAVLAANFTTGPTVTIDNTTPAVDDLLTATASGESPASSSYTYQWYSVHGGDPAAAISGATQSTYSVDAATVGDTIFVRVHATKPGYNDAIGNSTETAAVIKADFSVAPDVTISDTSPQLFQQVTAQVTGSTPIGAYDYQWYTVDGANEPVEIAGATNDTYTVTTDDLGLSLQVKVTATKPGYNDSSDTSPATDAVTKASFTTDPAVSIDNTTPTVGDELTAQIDTAADPAADSTTYQWYSIDGANPAVEISGATSDTFTVTGDEAGLALQVKVTASKDGYNDASGTSDATSAVAKASFTGAPSVTITGTAKVGSQLTANPSGETPAGSGYTYQWKADDVAISGATSSTFTPGAAQEGAVITVTVAATKSGYNDSATATSGPTDAVVKGDFGGTLVVTITGTAKVGVQLTANASGETPARDAYTYQWKADDADISGATGSTFTPGATLQGAVIKVTVTATKAGFNPSGAVTSAGTAAVAKGDFGGNLDVTIDDTTPTEGQLLTATASGETPAHDGAYAYQWKAGGTNVGTNSATYTPTSTDIGKTITVTVTASKTGYNDATDTSLPTTAVASAAPVPFTGTQALALSTTTPKVGDVVTVTPSGLTPAPDYSYDWYRIDTLGVRRVIPGAVGPSYTVPYADLTKKLQVEVTATKAGYVTQSTFSVQTARINYIALNKTSVTRGQTLGVNAKKLRAGQAYKIFIEGKSVYSGTASSDGSAIRTVGVPTSTPVGTGKRVWVSGYNKAGTRDFQVIGTVTVK